MSSGRWLSFAGVVAAVVVFVQINVLGSRFFQRWDTTSDGLYTLSDVTLETLEGLREPIEVVIFLSRSDPLHSSVLTLLDAYRARSSQLHVRTVDPDRDPAEFVALQREYGIFEGKTVDGRLATDASIVVARAEKRWYITTDDIIVFDDEDGQARPRLEAVLTEGIVNLLGRDKQLMCFTQGHQELSIKAGGPQGLAEFRSRLQRSNYDVREADLGRADPAAALRDCDGVAVVGPLVPFSQVATSALQGHLENGGSLLLAVGPLVSEAAGIQDPALAPLLGPYGIQFEPRLVFERDEQVALPIGFGGEVFLAEPQAHPITRSLVVGDSVRMRVVVQLSQALSLSESSIARPLLKSSERSVAIGSFQSLSEGTLVDIPKAQERSEILAAALELPNFRRANAVHPARLVVIASASPLWSNSWLEPSMVGTRRFIESATSWLLAQPALVSVPEKRKQPAGLFLTQESMDDVRRYVLLYVPLAVVLLGGVIMWRRRKEDDAPPDAEPTAKESK